MKTNRPRALSDRPRNPHTIFEQLTIDTKLIKSTQPVEKIKPIMNIKKAKKYIQCLKELAAAGWHEAAMHCARILLDGEILPNNNCEKIRRIRPHKQEGIRLLAVTAEKKFAPGQFFLGSCHDSGKGVKRNEEEANRLYKLAADQGYQPAIDALESISEERIGLMTSLPSLSSQNVSITPQSYESMTAMLNQWRREQEDLSLQHYKAAKAALRQLPHEQKNTSPQNYQSAIAAIDQWRRERETSSSQHYQSAIAALSEWQQKPRQENRPEDVCELPSQPPTPQPKR